MRATSPLTASRGASENCGENEAKQEHQQDDREACKGGGSSRAPLAPGSMKRSVNHPLDLLGLPRLVHVVLTTAENLRRLAIPAPGSTLATHVYSMAAPAAEDLTKGLQRSDKRRVPGTCARQVDGERDRLRLIERIW
ncbi:MAG: hypothetical protein M3Q48_02760 [Actinomycetota bacterium]|nr:hypothetical protein [Actinomycetota bacterium]